MQRNNVLCNSFFYGYEDHENGFYKKNLCTLLILSYGCSSHREVLFPSNLCACVVQKRSRCFKIVFQTLSHENNIMYQSARILHPTSIPIILLFKVISLLKEIYCLCNCLLVNDVDIDGFNGSTEQIWWKHYKNATSKYWIMLAHSTLFLG